MIWPDQNQAKRHNFVLNHYKKARNLTLYIQSKNQIKQILLVRITTIKALKKDKISEVPTKSVKR